jgi:pyrroloquinoline-quinone synthase
MTTEETLRDLDHLIRERSILHHPFYRAWQRGELTHEQLATYARGYYPHVAAFPKYLDNAIQCAVDPATKTTLEDNLLDELTNPEPHPDLWLDFAVATGEDRDLVKGAPPLSGVAQASSTFNRLTTHDIASGLTALYAYESQQPEVAAEKLRGLRESYGMQDPAALSYFRVHATADVEHRAGERSAISRCLEAGMSSAVIMNAANEALSAYWQLLDTVCEEANVQLTEVSP